MPWDDIVIAGVDESDEIGRVPGKTALMHHAEASRNALANAGLSLREVDGLFTVGAGFMPGIQLSEYLGIRPRYVDSTSVGGSSFVVYVQHAAAAIKAGLCEVALITHGEAGYSAPRSGWVRGGPGDLTLPGAQFDAPYGTGAAPSVYAMAAARHMAQYGTTHEQLAEIAVATRKWAALNPKALMRDPLTVTDVLESRWVTWPFHLLDCCLVTDAGGACVVTTAARARGLPGKPVRVLGSGEAHTHTSVSTMPDLTVTPAAQSGPQAMRMAGVSHADLDLLLLYDSFTYTVLVTLESLGFCKPGEGGAFFAGGRTAPGGELPVNTNGGGLSYTHSGMYGIFTLIEAVRQLRGQVLDACPSGVQGRHTYDHTKGCRAVKDAKLALVNGTGGILSSCGTLVLGVD